MCDISKRSLLPTARKQLSHDSTLWKLHEDNEPKYPWKLAVIWKENNGVAEIHGPSSCTHRKHMTTTQDKFKKTKRLKFDSGDQAEMGVLIIGINYKDLFIV